MTYINYIDEAKKKETQMLQSKHQDVVIPKGYLYIKPITHDYDEKLFNCNLLIYKPYDLSIILEEKISGIKLYMSDYDIVCTLIKLLNEKKEVADKIIHGLLERIDEKAICEFSFKLDDQKYSVSGIMPVDCNYELKVQGDVIITVNDFIALLNLIIEKESTSTEPNNLSGTLCKYIVFSKLFANNITSEEKAQLKNIISEIPQYDKLDNYEKIINGSKKNKLLISLDVFKKFYL